MLAGVVGFVLAAHDRNVARRLFLQQQFRCLDDGIGVEELAQMTVEGDVGDCRDRHAVMMGIIIVDHRAFLAFRHARRREVDGVVEAKLAERADLAQPLQVFERGRRVVLGWQAARHKAR